mmetsp:Transcript_11088/g.11456  ORF Transcript_11088/g.11456 Transcript_11088/m.11456 type:complete len:86 (+) Transcript_11088:16-273(+)
MVDAYLADDSKAKNLIAEKWDETGEDGDSAFEQVLMLIADELGSELVTPEDVFANYDGGLVKSEMSKDRLVGMSKSVFKAFEAKS